MGMRVKLSDALVKVARKEAANGSALAQALQRGRTVYESDPSDSMAIVRVAPDGTRTRGRLEQRTFVPAAAEALTLFESIGMSGCARRTSAPLAAV